MIRGIVRGNTIELKEETGLPEGQEVAVTIRPVASETPTTAASDRLKQAFGGWGDDSAGLDEFLEWNRRQRKVSRVERQS